MSEMKCPHSYPMGTDSAGRALLNMRTREKLKTKQESCPGQFRWLYLLFGKEPFGGREEERKAKEKKE